MLNSTDHEISIAHKKLQYRQIKRFLALSLSDVLFTMLINVKLPRAELSINFILLRNVKMPTMGGILTLISIINATSERRKATTSLFVSILVFMSS